MELIGVLERIGLTQNEAKIYLILLEEGLSTIGIITKRSRVSGSKTYEVLDRLIHKGLVSTITKNKIKHFQAARPEKLLDYLEEKKEIIVEEQNIIKKSLPTLLLKQGIQKKSEAQLFTGFEGLKTVTEDILNTLTAGEEWLSMGLSSQPPAWEEYFTKGHLRRAQKGIIIKHLLNEQYKTLHEKRKNIKGYYTRYLPKELDMPTSTEIYANKVIIMVLSPEQPLALLIENEAIAEGFRKYFNALWNSAKKA